MMIRRCLTAALLILGIGWFAAPSDAQVAGQRPSHVPIPHGNAPIDYESIFERRLQELEARQDLSRLFKSVDLNKLIQDFKKSGINPNDPKWKERIDDLLRKAGPNGQPLQLSPEERENAKRLIEDLMKGGHTPELPSLPDNGKTPMPPEPSDKRPAEPPPGPTNPGASAPPVDPAAQAEAREQIMRWASRLENMARNVQDSPAIQQAFQDMSRSLLDMQSNLLPSGERLDTQLAALNQMGRDSGKWFQDSFRSLGKFELPNMPQVDFSSLRTPSLSSLPSVSMPRGLSGMPSTSGDWQTILLIAGIVLVVLLGWKLLGRIVTAQRNRAGSDWNLGPWPIDPASVATREDVVRAFEYLSLLRLGYPAQSWNHRAIADRLGSDKAEQRALVAELADLYEQARYTPADEPMPAEKIARARQDLCQLAGVSAA